MNIRFFAHHRTVPMLPANIPDNISIHESCPYSVMVNNLSKCTFIITDSGGIQRTSAFFGKRALIMRKNSEWKDAEESDFARLAEFSKEDILWLTKKRTGREKDFYLNKELGKMPSSIIISKIMG